MAKQNNYWETRIQKIYDKHQKELSVDDLYRSVYESLHNEVKDLYSALKERDLTRTELYKSAKFLSFRKDLSRRLTDISGSLNDRLGKTLIKAYKDAGLAAKDSIGKKSVWTVQNRHMAEACIERSWAGDSFSNRIWKNRTQLAKQIEQDISGIVITGMGRNQLLKELNGLDYRERFHPPDGASQDEAEQALEAYLQRGRRQADCLVRTELMHTLNTAQIETYRGEGVNYLEFECEPTACPDCLAIAENNPYPINKIPCEIRHPNCRCTWLAVEDEDVEDVKRQYAEKNQALTEAQRGFRDRSYRNKAADKEQLARYKSVLGAENAPKSLDAFQDLKYNNSTAYESLKKSYRTISEIQNKSWESSFKDKAQNAYFDFKAEGVEMSSHAISRYLSRNGKDGIEYSFDSITKQSRKEFNYLQQDGRSVKYYNNVALVYNENQDTIVSLINRKNPKKDWRELL